MVRGCNPGILLSSVTTHNLSHTLDVLITGDEQTVNSVAVDPPALSDHSQIVGVLAARLPHPHPGTRQVRRCWRHFLADVNSRSRSLYAMADPSVCRLSYVCRL